MIKSNLSGNKTFQLILAASVAALLVLITYQGAFDNSFVSWDDYEYVVHNNLVINHENAALKDYFSTVISLNYHPLTILSLSFQDNSCESCLEGISARPFIIWNVILHILNTLLVFMLIYKLSGRKIIAATLVSILFGIHPMHVESVAWVSERKDVLYSFFFLAGLITFIKFRETEKNKWMWIALTFALFIFSCLSKATAVVFPLFLFLIIFWTSDTAETGTGIRGLAKAVKAKDVFLLLPFLGISLLAGLLALHIQDGGTLNGMLAFYKEPHDVVNEAGSFTVLQKLQVASYGFIVYIIKFFIPARLGILYPYPSATELLSTAWEMKLWGSLIIMVLLASGVIWSLKKTKLFFFGMGIYLICLILVLQFISVGYNMMAERYTYLSYLGLAFIPAILIAESTPLLKRILIFISACIIVVFIIISRKQVNVWHDSETLWSNVIDKYPQNERARSARGKYYYMLSSRATGNIEKHKLEGKAISDFSEAIKAKTGQAEVYEGMAVMLQLRGDLESALKYINAAISIDPQKGKTYYNRAMIRDRLGDKEEAIADYSRAVNLDESLAKEVLSNRSVLLLETGKYSQAIQDLDYLVETDSKNHMYYFNRAFARVQLGDIDGAMDDYRKVLAINPENREARNQLKILTDNFSEKK